jgi:putative peptidoglycan lipid II flippase
MAYAPGLLCVGISRVVVPAFYSMKDTRTPVWVSFWTLVVNLVAGLILMQYLQHIGLALALTLASLFNAVLLTVLLSRKIGSLNLRALFRSLLRILPGLILMTLATRFVLEFGQWEDVSYKLQNGLILILAVLTGATLYLVSCRLCGVAILSELRELMQRKKAG